MIDFSSLYDASVLHPDEPQSAARLAALQAAYSIDVVPTSLVGYTSVGYLLIVGGEGDALECAAMLRERLHCTIVPTGPAVSLSEEAQAAKDDTARVMVLHGEPGEISGHLGRFVATLKRADGQEISPAALVRPDKPWFDLVLDLRRQPAIRVEVPPFGYYAPAGDSERLHAMLAELPEMTGEFEKPRFFAYDADLCAHGESGMSGCTRCLDVCPTGAIRSLGDLVEVDPYLCQGAGPCTSVCPSGAMTYAYPGPRDQISRIKHMLAAFVEAGGENPVLVFHDEEDGLERLRSLADHLPPNALPVQLAEIGSAGMDVWLSALAYGASRLVLLDTATVPPSVRAAMREQIGFAHTLLDAMDMDGASRLVWLAPEADADEALSCTQPPAVGRAASFDTFNEKRGTLRLALDHLYQFAPDRPRLTDMPTGSPFGQVHVDKQACTLCMSCVQVCPTNALNDASDMPKLSFIEDLCVQCGLCATACPEDAITLEARFLFDWEERRKPRVLNEEAPFCCLQCGKPFATRSVIDRMTEKLSGHHMFQSEDALRRLQMCGDCRVTDMFAEDLKGGSKPRWLGPRD
ncbi:MAG TPA: 4Fe-4S binding protein [Azoarcus sp.]|nr:4Fe-4S binding protein [Azoarcus sp.]